MGDAGAEPDAKVSEADSLREAIAARGGSTLTRYGRRPVRVEEGELREELPEAAAACCLAAVAVARFTLGVARRDL